MECYFNTMTIDHVAKKVTVDYLVLFQTHFESCTTCPAVSRIPRSGGDTHSKAFRILP